MLGGLSDGFQQIISHNDLSESTNRKSSPEINLVMSVASATRLERKLEEVREESGGIFRQLSSSSTLIFAIAL
jgi:hypothetical protein